MDNSRFLACLAADYQRIREVVPGHLDARVPTCPDWTVADLTRHVGQVYLHKVECMRDGAERETEWPPAGLKDEEPVALLDRSYAELVTELTTRDPSDRGGTWYPLDPTVGFWFRRMAQETVIHRIDAELGAGTPIAPIPGDLAIDGIDELLRVFVAYSVTAWSDYFTDALAKSPGRTYKIQTIATPEASSTTWVIKTAPSTLTVTGGPVAGGPAADGLVKHGLVRGGTAAGTPADVTTPDITVTGTPGEVLRWSWNREIPGEPSRVKIEGDPAALAELHRCIVIATQ